ncbi:MULTISPECIES: nickel transporter permease [unclassified Paracoccus (in: a-proteobacteria)]|uniref:nickel transporter permease n=1 Tax=unclassified Paracoccus (in: a-proteobacteria) TaxID=2688777 RepID=UPI0015FF0F6D|nr:MULTISPECIES: nickel transporter permease [unclassified Paracoccus (in: a-proteobacteria)]MBB1491592.1 ABC transporter permease [Paracoccus sp. MC1854]MBB1498267.1 ABC transporter permease [Paracoccus sp. MC1862]QQO44966.1 ABC transporter permease [Paracoccus sp. MC1862]
MSDLSTRDWLLSDAPSTRRQARLGAFYQGWLTFRANRLAMLGLVILIALVLMAIFAPWLSPYDPVAQNLGDRLQPPSAAHWLGTDALGRDILSRIIWGSRVTLFIVGTVALISPILGLLIGTVAGFAGGWVDQVLMRITDIFLAFPKLILALALVAALGPGIVNAVLALAITGWPPYARLARAETLAVRNADYIAAARLQGAGPGRLLIGHIWPMCVSSLIVRVALDMAGIILSAAGLGFLGLGAQPPLPEWGAMISDGRTYILDHWWVAAMPGMAIFIVSLAFNLLGDGLRDVLDPKSAKQ